MPAQKPSNLLNVTPNYGNLLILLAFSFNLPENLVTDVTDAWDNYIGKPLHEI